MSITIQNLRIIPYGQKDTLKPVFGDTMHLTFRIADAPIDGDRYLLGLDYERILFPTMRPLCAYTEDYTADQNDISFDLAINTERFALWASTLKKPTPIWLQLVRVRGEEYTTILLDDILALPSVVDGANMVFPGTPLEDILENKADLVGGKVPLSQLPTIGFEQQQADWDESDSSEPSYIRNKPEIGGARWGSITGDLSSQTDLAGALDGKANLVGGKVPSAELPVAKIGNQHAYDKQGIVSVYNYYGGQSLKIDGGSLYFTALKESSPGERALIDDKANHTYAIGPSSLDYAVRSVLPNVTTIPAATTSYSLLDASATTNSHSWQYAHAPAAASTYTFPAVTDTAVAHRIKLTLDFTAVQTYSFEDASGNALTPLFTPTISAGDVYEFDCEYSAVKAQWLIWPHKQGAVSDDYVMQSQVGAANGVAGLDGNKKLSASALPITSNFGITNMNGYATTAQADSGNIDARNNQYRPIVPANLNYAVTAALTDAHKIQLTDAQKASAQDTLGIWSPPVTVIPAATTAYTLGEGMQSHVPEAASVYALPSVTDSTRTHECILTVRFSSSVLTYSFEDSAGNPITPLPLAGTIADGSVVCFRCTWEALLGQWVVMPVMLGTYQEVEP